MESTDHSGSLTERLISDTQVPTSPFGNTVHANGALGVAYLTYIAPESNLESFSRQLKAAYGSEPTKKTINSVEVLLWRLYAPNPVTVHIDGFEKELHPQIRLRAADEAKGEDKRGSGLWEVAFWVDADGGEAESKWGKIRFVNVADA